MKNVWLSVALTAVLFGAVPLSADYREFLAVPKDPTLEAQLLRAAEQSLAAYPALEAEDLALSVIDVTDASRMARADVRGDVNFYPASVIKLFFMVETYLQHKENGPDVPRALKEMIVVSDNDATAYIVDIIAGMAPAPSLEGRAFRRFLERRRVVNRDFAKLGYDISGVIKAWSFGPFGIERQLLGENRENRNRLTANATASLMLWIARRRAVSPSASEAMMTLLSRRISPAPTEEEGGQVTEFIGEALPADAKLWSKAGWTSEVRHDAAYLELPNGRKLVLVVYTRGVAADKTLLPAIARNVLGELGGGR
ncbi:MAG TPA: serine hydrolase [Thermoanaerobaculia bacterium]